MQLFLIDTGDSYFAENGNQPIHMTENENIAYISTDYGNKNSDGNGNIVLDDRKTEIVKIIVTEIGNHGSKEPLM